MQDVPPIGNQTPPPPPPPGAASAANDRERDLIAKGLYKAKVIGYALVETAKGLPSPAIKFELIVGEAKEHLTWYGSLNEGTARNITGKALLVCGFSGTDISKMAEGPSSGVLDMAKEVLLDVDIETDTNGKKRNRVQWINELGGAAFQKAMTKATAVQKCAGLNFGADIMRLRQEHGYKDPASTATAPVAAAGKLSAAEIPF